LILIPILTEDNGKDAAAKTLGKSFWIIAAVLPISGQ
jgi:hypothetical protein